MKFHSSLHLISLIQLLSYWWLLTAELVLSYCFCVSRVFRNTFKRNHRNHNDSVEASYVFAYAGNILGYVQMHYFTQVRMSFNYNSCKKGEPQSVVTHYSDKGWYVGAKYMLYKKGERSVHFLALRQVHRHTTLSTAIFFDKLTEKIKGIRLDVSQIVLQYLLPNGTIHLLIRNYKSHVVSLMSHKNFYAVFYWLTLVQREFANNTWPKINRIINHLDTIQR